MTYCEEVVQFACAGETLIGVVTRPDQPSRVGILVLVGGPQVRVGSHRQFLLLSRHLASHGYAAMRFDFRGMGDSSGEFPGFEGLAPDIDTALGAFQATCPEVERVVLWGLCDAASAGLLYWDVRHDHRVAGLCLLNPWVRSEATLARTYVKRYYFQRFVSREFWAKLLGGHFDWGKSIHGLGQALRSAVTPNSGSLTETTFQARMARALNDFSGPVLVVLSGEDFTAREFEELVGSDPLWRGVLTQPNVLCQRIDGADHTFSTGKWRGEVEKITMNWLRGGL